MSAADAAPTWITATVPGAPLELALSPAAPLAVRVPALFTDDRLATLTLESANGMPFAGVEPGGAPRWRWTLSGGRVVVDGVPAGVWTVRASVPDGRVWTAVAATTGTAPAEVSLE